MATTLVRSAAVPRDVFPRDAGVAIGWLGREIAVDSTVVMALGSCRARVGG